MSTMISPDVRQRLEEIGQMPAVLPVDQWRSHNIKEVGPGGVLKIEAKVYLVKRKHRYTAPGNYVWFELELYCVSDGKNYYLEWEVDDALEVSLSGERISVQAVGSSPAFLERVDDRESGSIGHNGRNYTYEESDQAIFFADCEGDGEPLYYWDFVSGSHGLSIERWGDKYAAYLWDEVHPGSIEVLSVG